MRTSKQVRDEVLDIVTKNCDKNGHVSNKIQKRLNFLNHLALYLDTEPSEDVVCAQLTETDRKLKFLAERFPKFHPVGKALPEKARRQLFNKIYETLKLREQKRTLSYILHHNHEATLK